MRITVKYGPYNERRYGRPWLAVVTAWPIGKHPTLEFGSNLDRCTAEIDAEPGAVVRWGQKDHRGNKTESRWGIVQIDGTRVECTASEARDHWLAGCPVPGAGGNVVPLREG